MCNDEMITEISMRCDIPMDTVEEVLDERECIIEEECRRIRRRKRAACSLMITFFMLGAGVVLYLLDKKEKIDMQLTMKNYMDKSMEKIKSLQAQLDRFTR